MEVPVRYWSDVNSWDETNKIPEEGDDVYIASSWNMVLDLQETPAFNKIVIDGRLSFKTDIGDITIKAKTIWVKTGQFFIGDVDSPFPNQVTIILDGEREDDTVPITSIETGNKVLANTGVVRFYG